MSAIEIMTSMTASTSNWNAMPGRGVSEFTRTELAAMLSGISRPAQLLAWAKYLDDQGAFNQLKFHMISKSAELAAKQNWKIIKGKPFCYNLGVLVAYEIISEAAASQSDSKKAKTIGVCKSSWSKTWNERRNELFYYAQDLDLSIKNAIKGQLSHSIFA